MTRFTGIPQSQTLPELLTQYLDRQTQAERDGLAYNSAGEAVEPFEAAPSQPIDPQQAWADGLAVASHFWADSIAWKVPNCWSSLVSGCAPGVAIPFALGNFPQQLRDLQMVANAPTAARPVVVEGLIDWAHKQRSLPNSLLAAALLRLAAHFEMAEQLLSATGDTGAWQGLHANEVAALAWQRGEREQALALWEKQDPALPVMFNRGMAQLFLDQPVSARASLNQAVASLPETSSWHHLGQLYRMLAG